MGDIGIDKWVWKMAEHKRKGHHVIIYDGRTMDDIEQELLLKEQRVKFWEQNKHILNGLSLNNLSLCRLEAKA